MSFNESELVMISALQHYLFCPRRCALIHLEGAWVENTFTAEGHNLHERAHSDKTETRPDCRKIFNMPVRSLTLGISGKCDVVMVTPEGQYIPLEYKRGKPKIKDMDLVQLCAQALCIEEMVKTIISEGYIYYFGIRKRLHVLLDMELRELTVKTINNVHQMFKRGVTPPAVYGKHCHSCSLMEICLPGLTEKPKPVDGYVEKMLAQSLTPDEGGGE